MRSLGWWMVWEAGGSGTVTSFLEVLEVLEVCCRRYSGLVLFNVSSLCLHCLLPATALLPHPPLPAYLHTIAPAA